MRETVEMLWELRWGFYMSAVLLALGSCGLVSCEVLP